MPYCFARRVNSVGYSEIEEPIRLRKKTLSSACEVPVYANKVYYLFLGGIKLLLYYSGQRQTILLVNRKALAFKELILVP